MSELLSGSQQNFDDSTAKLCRGGSSDWEQILVGPALLRHVKNCILSEAGPLRDSPSFLEGLGQGWREHKKGGEQSHTSGVIAPDSRSWFHTVREGLER